MDDEESLCGLAVAITAKNKQKSRGADSTTGFDASQTHAENIGLRGKIHQKLSSKRAENAPVIALTRQHVDNSGASERFWRQEKQVNSIVFCCDGTENEFALKITNAVKLHSMLAHDES